LAFVGTIAVSVTGVGLLDAFTHSVAAISTSAPLPGVASAYVFSPLAVFVVAFLLFIGATGVSLHVDAFRPTAWKNYYKDGEVLSLMVGVVVLAAIIWVVNGFVDLRYILEALSLLSTSGMNVTGATSVIDILPQPIPDLFAFVGAAALSTAGGLKISRIIVLVNRAATEFRRLSFDKSQARLRFQGRARADAIVVGVWVYLVAYLGVTILLGMALALSGASLEDSFRAGIGAISSTGPLTDVVIYDQAPGPCTLMIMNVGFVLGRVEVLILAPLFSRDFWRR
jgi:Trk-type K+ transport system membrane component